MTSTYPALRGRFGNTEYYLITMPVGAVIRHVVIPEMMPEWGDLSIEEKYQRKINEKRVMDNIAPYFATDQCRFSGSLILAIKNPAKIRFEDISKLARDMPVAYDSANMGFLTLSDEEVLIPLDGQHRVQAFKIAISGNSDKQIVPNHELAKDHVTVILTHFDKVKSRYIFNKINKYAKPTMRGDKLITDDDDAVAVMARRMVADDVIPSRLVNISSNSLNSKSIEFTTLGTIYDATRALINGARIPCAVKPSEISYAEREQLTVELSKEWKALIAGICMWRDMLQDASAKGDSLRTKARKKSLLAWPVGQLSLIQGYSFVCQRDRDTDRRELIRKLDKIDWGLTADTWREILVDPNGKIKFGKSVINNASKIVAHMIGANLDRDEAGDLLESIYGTRHGKRLPEQIR